MAKPHKYAWNGLDFETALPIEHVANMAQRAAQESTGDLLKGKHRIVSTRSGDREIEFRVNDFLISFKKFMVFSLTFQPTGDRLFGTSTIGWYMTSQQTVGGFVPVSTKSMVAHNTYMQFARNLAEQIRLADPTARVTIREGVEPVGVVPAVPAAPVSVSDGAAAALSSAQHGAPPRPLQPPAGGVRPLPPPPPPSAPSGFAPPPPPPAAPSGFAPPPPPPPPTVTAPPIAPPMPQSGGLVTGIPGMPPKPTSRSQMPAVPPPPPATPPIAPSLGVVPPPPALLVDAPPLVVQIFAEDDDLDSTRISQATAGARPWSLVVSDGQRLDVDAPIVIGRDPVVPASVSFGRSVPVVDKWKSVSKTHAVIEVRDGMLWVTDLHSTNGTTITNAVGEAMTCPPEVAMPVGDGWTISAAEVSIVASLGA